MDILTLLKNTNAILKGHFLLSSGFHSDTYIQCAKVLKYPKYAVLLGKELFKLFKKKPDYVISPALGGIIIGYEVARNFDVPFLFTERDEKGNMVLRRGFSMEKNSKIVIIEDVITTGKSTKEVIEAIEDYEPRIIGIGCIVNRTGSDYMDEFYINSLLKINIKTYEPENCPLCKAGLPLIKPGSRK